MKNTVKPTAFVILVDNCYHPGTLNVPEDGYLVDDTDTTSKIYQALAFPSKTLAEKFLISRLGATKCAEPDVDTYCNFGCNQLDYGQYSRPEYSIKATTNKKVLAKIASA